MRGADTNIIIRLLLRDDEQQAKKVYTLFKEVEAEKGILFVPLLVVLELIWVLESVYKISSPIAKRTNQRACASPRPFGIDPCEEFYTTSLKRFSEYRPLIPFTGLGIFSCFD
jgi:predicted nucleic acid-binding protein